MKKILLIILICSVALHTRLAHAQIKGNLFDGGLVTNFANDSIKNGQGDFKIYAIYPGHIIYNKIPDYNNNNDKEPDSKQVQDSIASYEAHVKTVADGQQSTDTIIIAINASSLKEDTSFTYRVLKDGKTYLDWQKIKFTPDKKIERNYYELMRGTDYGHQYIIEVKDNEGKRFVTVSHKHFFAPVMWGVFFEAQKEAVIKATTGKKIDSSVVALLPRVPYEQYGNLTHYDTFGKITIPLLNISYSNADLTFGGKGIYRIPNDLDMPSTHNSMLILMGDIADTQAYEYQLVKENEPKDTAWHKNEKGNNIIELHNLDHGNYALKIRLSNFGSYSISYNINIRPLWYQTRGVNFGGGFIIGILIVMVPFFTYKAFRKRARQQKELKHRMTALQLQSYRAQLNPHFIFNALSSIQSLVNRNDTAKANEYLTYFSELLRMTLDQRKAEFWTLKDEIELLNKYITLEQLRFNFSYKLSADSNLHATDISFPSMLLQPIVENAVKHGISRYHEEGSLVIIIQKEDKDLLINITDNGEGFDTSSINKNGHGLALTTERIAFLNEAAGSRQIQFTLASSVKGTIATIRFNNYL